MWACADKPARGGRRLIGWYEKQIYIVQKNMKMKQTYSQQKKKRLLLLRGNSSVVAEVLKVCSGPY